MLTAFALVSVMAVSSGTVHIDAEDPDCTAAIGALFKGIATTPRKVTTIDGQGNANQAIFRDGKVYMQVDGKWKASNYDADREIWNAKEGLRFANPDCNYLGEELYHGIRTTVYDIITYEDTHRIQHKIWIAPSGLPIEIISDDYLGDHEVHSTQVFEYGKIEVPK